LRLADSEDNRETKRMKDSFELDQALRQRQLEAMKSAYELAMERLAKSSPSMVLSDDQKKELAELDSKYAAKIAERELFLKGEMDKSAEQGDFEALAQLEKQLSSERNRLRTELEEKKDLIRNRGK
jgi:hypothetical protein